MGGVNNASKMLCTGRMWPAKEALHIGAVDEIVPTAEAHARAVAKVKDYLRAGENARRFFKRKLNADVLELMEQTETVAVENALKCLQLKSVRKRIKRVVAPKKKRS